MDPRIERAREIIAREADAVRQVATRIGEDFVRAVDLVLALAGRVVTAGMGKAGIIAGPGGEKIFEHFEKYLRRCTYAFENNTVTLMRFVMARRG